MTEGRGHVSGPSPCLWLVATPIGNLADVSQRAIEVLRDVSFVACEDTRRTGLLLQRLGIGPRPLLAVYEHNEATAAAEIIERLTAGETAAYVTDAGMPAISDPGQRLVQAVAAAGLPVSAVPGPSAPIAALAVSGLPTDRWAMEGFLPRSTQARAARLAEVAREQRTVILLESPKRLPATLAELAKACGTDRSAAVVRELTKLHEEVARGTVAELAARFADPPRGEIVLVIGPAAPRVPSDEEIAAALTEALDAGLSARDAATAVAQQLGISRNRTYPKAVTLARDSGTRPRQRAKTQISERRGAAADSATLRPAGSREQKTLPPLDAGAAPDAQRQQAAEPPLTTLQAWPPTTSRRRSTT